MFKQKILFNCGTTTTLSIKMLCSYYLKKQFSGKYSYGLHTGNLIIPRKVDHNGQHISHNVTHHHHDSSTEKIHYRIDINNDTSMHIELQ